MDQSRYAVVSHRVMIFVGSKSNFFSTLQKENINQQVPCGNNSRKLEGGEKTGVMCRGEETGRYLQKRRETRRRGAFRWKQRGGTFRKEKRLEEEVPTKKKRDDKIRERGIPAELQAELAVYVSHVYITRQPLVPIKSPIRGTILPTSSFSVKWRRKLPQWWLLLRGRPELLRWLRLGSKLQITLNLIVRTKFLLHMYMWYFEASTRAHILIRAMCICQTYLTNFTDVRRLQVRSEPR